MEEEEIKQLKIERFEQIPSPSVFESQIESKNVPAVFNGCIKQWKAFTRWNPANGGLDYLQEKVGTSTVEAMLSRTAPVFYGDLRSHERVPFPFTTFIDNCKQHMLKVDQGHDQPAVVSIAEEEHSPQKIYLAQVPIVNTEDLERVQLGALREDIQMPVFLETKEPASVNLWMNNAYARSSSHYDPHHNVLCIIAGRKQVTLWPPSASPSLYPMPIYGEASNHSSVSLENPDFSLYPRAEGSLGYSQVVVLHAGDALFIPEGWFHQVDSDDLTIAVNIWWRSNVMCSMLEHMDAYYLRRIMKRLTDKEMNHMLPKTSSPPDMRKMHTCELMSNGKADSSHSDSGFVHTCQETDLQGRDKDHRINLHMLEPFSLQALHELVSLVHDRVNLTDLNQPVKSTSTNDSVVSSQHDKTVRSIFVLDDDPVAKILWTLGPHILQNVLLAMASNFPRTLEALVLHLLSPIGAEALTQKFDEMDQQNTEEDRNKFYQVFYAAFDDQFSAMDAILNAKESFALQAFKNVLDKYLQVNFDVLKPSTR